MVEEAWQLNGALTLKRVVRRVVLFSAAAAAAFNKNPFIENKGQDLLHPTEQFPSSCVLCAWVKNQGDLISNLDLAKWKQ